MARILHLIAANHRRGAETFAVELAEHLRVVEHDVRVMAVTDAGVEEPLPVEVAGKHRFDATGSRKIVRAAAWADVVVSFGSSSLLIGAMAAQLMRKPFVYRNIGDPSVWGRVRLSDLRIGTPVRSARAVVALYPDAARTLTTRYHLDPSAVRIIPRGVPEQRFLPANPEDRLHAAEQLGLDPNTQWVAYVGSLSGEKDPLLAIEALSHLPADVGLVLAGDGPLMSEARLRAAPFGERCRLLGVLDDVRPLYAASNALVLPSRTEGIPGAAVEAGLCGLPVATFDVGGVSSVVIDGVTGSITRTRSPDALAASIGESLVHQSSYGPAARAHCLERFSMSVVGRAWEDVITDVTRDAPSPPATRVLQVVSSKERRGAEVFAHQLEAELMGDGFSVNTVAVTANTHADALPFRSLGRSRFHPATLARLTREVRRHDLTIVHGGAGLWPSAFASLLTRRPFVYRGIGEPIYWGRVPGGRIRIGWPLRRADAVVALHPSAAEDLIRMYGLEPQRLSVIANAVPAEQFPRVTPERRVAARTALGLRPVGAGHLSWPGVIGYLGALSTEKRPEWTVEIAERLPDIEVVIAGTGPLESRLRHDAERRCPGRIHFLGNVSKPESVLDALDVLILPSRTEGMPACLIEAAMVGVPVVATDVGAVASVVDQLEAGRVVASDDFEGFVRATEDVLGDPGRCTPDRRKAVAEHDLPKAARQWGRLITRLSNDSGRP